MIGPTPSAAAQESSLRSKLGELPTISIVIKALNEEAKIGRCIESALAALRELPNPSEIILADSVSADHTVEIAKQFPITIVQFENAAERGCGAAVQLGYQHSRGDFVMLLDGDMQLLPGFLRIALARFDDDPTLAGVAGLVEDTSVVNAFDRRRVDRGPSSRPRRSLPWLNGGGLYRRSAIVEAGGYAADRNLKAWEEADLGMRLTSAGWALERIDFRSTLHTGHAAGTAALLRSMWTSRRAMANGVLIKQSIGKPWWFQTITLMKHPMLVIFTWVGALAAVCISMWSHRWAWAAGYAVAVAGLALVLALYRRSFRQAMTSIGMWHFMAAGLLAGLRDPVSDPVSRIQSITLAIPEQPNSTMPQGQLNNILDRQVFDRHGVLKLGQR